jgi:hypothetical protein
MPLTEMHVNGLARSRGLPPWQKVNGLSRLQRSAVLAAR